MWWVVRSIPVPAANPCCGGCSSLKKLPGRNPNVPNTARMMIQSTQEPIGVLYTTNDAAKLIGVSTESVRLYVAKGSLRMAFKTPFGERLFYPADVEDFKQKRDAKKAAKVDPVTETTEKTCPCCGKSMRLVWLREDGTTRELTDAEKQQAQALQEPQREELPRLHRA